MILNKRSTSSQKSGSRTASSYASSSFSRSLANSLTGFVLEMVQEKSFAFDSAILLILELYPLFSFVMLSLSSVLATSDEDTFSIAKYAFLLVNPTMIDWSFTIFLVFYIFFALVVVAVAGAFILTLYLQTSNQFVLAIIFWLIRLLRTVLFFPAMTIFLSYLQCGFIDSSFTLYHQDDRSCVELPDVMFMIFGFIFAIIVFALGSLDVIFLQDRFRSCDITTATPDGRFSFLIFLLYTISIVIYQFCMYQGEPLAMIIGDIIVIVLTLILLVLLIRFIPFFKRKMTFIFAAAFVITICFRLSSALNIGTENIHGLYALILIIPFLLFIFAILLIRFLLMTAFFRKKKISSSFFLCYFSVDLAIGLYQVKRRKKKGFISGGCSGLLKNLWKSVFGKKSNPNSSVDAIKGDSKLTNAILVVMENPTFSKSKSICQMLIPLVIDSNIHLAQRILSHTNTIMGTTLIDTDISLQICKKMVTSRQQASKGSSGNKQASFIRSLDVTRSHESELELLYQLVFEKLTIDDSRKKVKFSSFPKIFSMIQEHQEFCEDAFEKVIQKYPNPTTYRRYGAFCLKFLNDVKSASIYLREANDLEIAFKNSSALQKQGVRKHINEVNTPDPSSTSNMTSSVDYEKRMEEMKRNEGRSGSSDDSKEKDDDDDDENSFSEDVISHSNIDDERTMEEEISQGSDNSNSNSYRGGSNEGDEDTAQSVISNVESVKDDDGYSIDDKSKSGGFDDYLNPKNIKKNQQQQQPRTSNEIIMSKREEKIEIEENNNNKQITPLSPSTNPLGINNNNIKRCIGPETEMLMNDLGSVVMSSTSSGFHTTKTHNSSIGGSKLRKKLDRERFVSVEVMRIICIFVFLVAIACIVTMFGVSVATQSSVNSSGELMEIASRIRRSGVASAHFLRKLQISGYDSSKTFFPHERNTTAFRERTYRSCKELRDQLEELYMELGTLGKLEFQKKKEFIEKIRDGEFVYKDMTLLDGVTDYSQRCMNVLNLKDEDYGNREIGSRMEDNDDFVMITLNEPYIYEGLQDVLLVMMNEFQDEFLLNMVLFCVTPTLLFLLIPMICCGYCVYNFELRRTFKGLLLVPGQEILRLSRKYGKQDGDDVEQKIKLARCSLILKFILFLIFVIFVLVFCCLPISILGVVACQGATNRNREFDYALRIAVTVHRVHLWSVELVYRDDTLFPTDEIVDGMEVDLDNLERRYLNLRFGNDEKQLEGNDDDVDLYDIYYVDTCTSDGLSGSDADNEFDRVQCLSLNDKISLMIRSANLLLESNYTDPQSRKSPHYETIIILDNISNGTRLQDTGAIQSSLRQLEDVIRKKADAELNYLTIASYLFIIIFFPCFVIIFLFISYSYPRKLSRSLTNTKRILMLMDKEILGKTEVFNYMSGRGKKNAISRIFSKTKRNNLEMLMEILNNSHFSVVIFSKDGSIARYNNSADRMFRILAGDVKNMRSILDEESFLKIRNWIALQGGKGKINENNMNTVEDQLLTLTYEKEGKSLVRKNIDNAITKSCKTEVVVSTAKNSSHDNNMNDNNKFVVSAHLHTDFNICIGVFEDIHSSKKKEMLINNFLPKEVALKLNLSELGKSNTDFYLEEHKSVTCFFCDICNFSTMTGELDPVDLVNLLHKFFGALDDILEEFRMEKIKTMGDAYFAVSGVPTYNVHHATNAMNYSLKVLEICKEVKLECRIGLSSGPAAAGIIGKKKFVYDCFGKTINDGALMERVGIPNKIQVSRSSYELLFEEFPFILRKIQVKGKGVVKAYVYTEDGFDPTASTNSLQSGFESRNFEIDEVQRKKDEEEYEELFKSKKKESEEEICDDEEEEEEEEEDDLEDEREIPQEITNSLRSLEYYKSASKRIEFIKKKIGKEEKEMEEHEHEEGVIDENKSSKTNSSESFETSSPDFDEETPPKISIESETPENENDEIEQVHIPVNNTDLYYQEASDKNEEFEQEEQEEEQEQEEKEKDVEKVLEEEIKEEDIEEVESNPIVETISSLDEDVMEDIESQD